MSEGIDLYAANTVVFLEQAWVPYMNDQAQWRTMIPEKQQPVTVYTLVAEDTVDDSLQQVLVVKRMFSDEAMITRDVLLERGRISNQTLI